MESPAKCPVCDEEFLIWGPDGVMVHLLADHAERSDVRWLMQQREVPQLEVQATQREYGLRPAC